MEKHFINSYDLQFDEYIYCEKYIHHHHANKPVQVIHKPGQKKKTSQ